MSKSDNPLSRRGLYIAVLMMAGFVILGFKPATENSYQEPEFKFQVLCENENGDEILLLPGENGLVNLKAVSAKEIGKTIKLCKEFGSFVRVIPKSEDGPIIIIG